MNTTTFKSRLSPIQPKGYQSPISRKPSTVSNEEHPVRKAVRELCGTFQLTATFTEDSETLSTLRVPGLVAVKCLLEKDGHAVGIGHGTAVSSRLNKGLERTSFICMNAAFLSAANSACKVLDSLRMDEHDATPPKGWTGPYEPREEESANLATDKQKAYARQLLSLNVEDEADREQIGSTLDDMTKDEISSLIQRFAR